MFVIFNGPLTPFWFGLPPSADQVQREIVAGLIIVIVIMNKENDHNFAQSKLNEESRVD